MWKTRSTKTHTEPFTISCMTPISKNATSAVKPDTTTDVSSIASEESIRSDKHGLALCYNA